MAVPPAEAQLKLHRLEIRLPHFPGNIQYDGIRRLPQAAEQIPEAGGLVLILLYLRGGIALHIALHHMAQRLVVHLSVSALLLHLAVHIFQQIVQEGAHLRSLKARLLPLPGPQAVFHEIAEMAGLHPVDTAGGHGDEAAVQRLHRLRREPSPLHPPCTGHGGKGRRVLGLPLEIPPQGFILPGGAQSRGRQRHAVGAVLPLYLQLREQQPHPLHHEGGPQLRAGHIGDRP